MKKRKPRRYDPVIAEAERVLAMAAALPPPQIGWTSRAPVDRGQAREPGAEWVVGVAPWLVDDGAYGMLYAGRDIDFALRWEEIALEPADVERPRAFALGEDVYYVEATVVHVGEDACVLDFGLLAYSTDAPAWMREGMTVRGDVAVAIDAGTYRDQLFDELESVAMIYPWRLDRIVLEVAARTPAPAHLRELSRSPELMTNDPERRTLREVAVANPDKDWPPGQMARYYLHCTLQSRIPRMPDARDQHPMFDESPDA